MTGRLRRCLSIGLCALLVATSAAPAEDRFQSAPGPEAPKPKRRPNPPRQVEPEPQAPTASIPEVSGELNNKGMRFDGFWMGVWECNPVSYPLVFEVKNHNVSKFNSRTSVPGTPGYDHYEGTIAPDGRVLLTRHAVGEGLVPGALARGQAITVSYDGLFSGDNFTGTERSSRGCRIRLTRHRYR
jgi:hypothetical protein